MTCARCRQNNRAGSRFCEHCGTSLLLACTACGAELSPSARFCGLCGHPAGSGPSPAEAATRSPQVYTPPHLAAKILMSRAALEGERKQVTVLFADLKSSMELLADRDPEEARALLDPILELMMEAVHHYEGTVNQVMGDGIMALFGAPLAYEDHALRACFAALRMQDRVRRHAETIPDSLGLIIRIRIGLNSGEVVVRSVGSDLRMDYSAVGQTTHLAARMEQMAEPGSILATVHTARLVEGSVQATSQGRVAIRGLETAVEVYTITDSGTVREPLAAAVSRGLTRFVGREGESAQLAAAAQSAARSQGQAVGLVGDPGVGKSRLFYEFTRADRLPGWLVLKAGAVSYGRGTPYGPVVDLLRTYFKAEERDAPRDVGERITAKLQALELDPAMAPAFFSLLDVSIEDQQWVSLDPRQRRRRTMDALLQLFLHESRVQPLCIVLEDLHWIDSETQEFLDNLVESLPTARILMLVDYRPEYRHEWGSRTYYVQLRVDPLSPSSVQQLLRDLLGNDDALVPLKQLLVERTEGNPFFLEESIRTLVEIGALEGERGACRLAKPVEAIRVPPTVQAVLAARIDRLAPEDKWILQTAAVIGESVPVGLLQAVTEIPEPEMLDSLRRLRAAQFLHETSPVSEPLHIFRHGLTCRVAYNSLLQESRRSLHARIVEAMERIYSERLGEHIERLAYHASQGEQWARATRYLRQAGARAFERSANREAVAWFEQALQVLARLPDGPATRGEALDVHLGLRNALTLLGEHERTLDHLHQAQALAERLGDRQRLGRALSFEVNCRFLLGQHEQAIDCAQRVRVVAEALGDVGLNAVTQIYAGRAHLALGDYERAIQVLSAVVGLLTGPLARDRLGVTALPSVFARSHLVECLAAVGRFEESSRYASEAVALAETTSGHPDTLLWAHHAAGLHHLARGEVRPAIEALERGYRVCLAHDMPTYRPRFSAELALAWALDGRAAEAVPIVQQAVDEAAARRQTASHSLVLGLLAEVYVLADHPAEAAEAARRALAMFHRQRERGHEARALWLLAEIAARKEPSPAAEAETTYAEASALCETLGMKPLRARCALGLARLLVRTAQTDRARQAFQTAAAWFRELGMHADLARAEVERRTIEHDGEGRA